MAKLTSDETSSTRYLASMRMEAPIELNSVRRDASEKTLEGGQLGIETSARFVIRERRSHNRVAAYSSAKYQSIAFRVPFPDTTLRYPCTRTDSSPTRVNDSFVTCRSGIPRRKCNYNAPSGRHGGEEARVYFELSPLAQTVDDCVTVSRETLRAET